MAVIMFILYILVAPGGSNTLEAKGRMRIRPFASSVLLHQPPLPLEDGQIIDGLARAMVARAAACLIGLICEHWAVASSLLRDNASAPPSIGSP